MLKTNKDRLISSRAEFSPENWKYIRKEKAEVTSSLCDTIDFRSDSKNPKAAGDEIQNNPRNIVALLPPIV